MRAEAVEVAQAGDKCDFTGTLIVVPDVRQLNVPGKQLYQPHSTGSSLLVMCLRNALKVVILSLNT